MKHAWYQSLSKALLVIILTISGILPLSAQVTVVIGPGWNGHHAISSPDPVDGVPYNYNNASVHLQTIYTAAEMYLGGATGPIRIDSLGWNVYSQISAPLVNYTIQMKNTTATDVQVFDGLNLTMVKNPADLNPATDTGWYMIPLNTPFIWDGTGSLLIDVCWGLNPSYNPSGQIRHVALWATSYERILLKSNTSLTCGIPPAQTASHKPYLRLTGTSSAHLEQTPSHHLKIYPNPTTGKVTLELEKEFHHLEVEVYDLAGHVVEHTNFFSTDKVELNFNYPLGVYFVHALMDNHSRIFKVFKE